MAFPIDPGRPPGIQPLEDQVPNQGNVDPRAMLPLAPAREQQHHDVRQHAGLGHGQHGDQDMNLEDMLPLRQAFNLDQDDAMLEDDNNQLREQEVGSKRAEVARPRKRRYVKKEKIWCEALPAAPPWRALSVVSQLSTQSRKNGFFGRLELKTAEKRKNTRFYYLSSSEIWLHFQN